MNQLAQYFPSGLSISRAKKDAKKLKKAKAIPLNQALDEIAQSEMNLTWEQALKALSSNVYEQNTSLNEEVLTLPEAALNPEKTSVEAMTEESCEQSDEQDELLDEDEEKGEVNFTHTIYNSQLIAFEEMVDKNSGQADTFIYPANEVFIQGNGNGTKLWPSPLAATESNADLLCNMLNKFSLRIFEYELIDTIYEDEIGETSYEMWYESNSPIYESSDCEREITADPDYIHVKSQRSLYFVINMVRSTLISWELEM
ncbi:hypothetical protein H5159_15705 [Pseudoalteromonas sp. SG43-1]|uniref:hypothetical protein n=1 Tax=Pseudoalteromonas sp. SG43-1 TaxID=2760971 RepID=UPI00160442F5|nr:hypothetical protein [Pseudoalteromonas sp. SG43-1]MBB1452490.1 hypothetical protein [Pseudoalteromonas sp. SG43-1]